MGRITCPVTFDKICGIYYLKNLTNGKMYIGQSQDIWKRIQEHFHHHQRPLVDKDLYENKGQFEIGILCRCKPEELDYYERYYINEYDTLNAGYNQTFGGKGSIGITNPTSKLSEEEVYQIREDFSSTYVL